MSETTGTVPTPDPAPLPTPAPSPRQPKGNRILLWISVLCLLAGLGAYGWTWYIGTEGYRARKQLSNADQLARDGKLGEAARGYRNLALEFPSRTPAALAGFKKLLGNSLDAAPLDQVADVLEVSVTWPDAPHLRDDLGDRGVALLRDRGEKDIDGALKLLNIVIRTAMDEKHEKKLAGECDELLEGWAKKFPDHVEVLTNFAYVLHRRGDMKAIEKMLAPHREKLGNGEGVYLLAIAYANLGKSGEAIALLEPYCKERLPRYVKASADYRKVYAELESTIGPQIKDGTAPDFDFDLYRRSNEPTKRVLAGRYIADRVQENTEGRAALVELNRLYSLHQAVMELGQLQFMAAKSQLDPVARQAGLEKARDTFLSLRETRKDGSNVYLYAGTVAYWMGDTKEGQKQFEVPLQKTGRAPGALLEVADAYRSVGEFELARKLIEEAYARIKDPGLKFEAAFRRSKTPIDTEDEIAWLKKCDANSDLIKLALVQSQAKLAEDQGRFKDAAEQLRKAIEMVKSFPDSPGTNNETGLFWFWLFRVSGDKAALTKGLEYMDKAMAQSPANGIIVHNAALNVYQNACLDLALDAIEPAALWTQEGLNLLDYFYNDRPGRDEQAARVRKNSGLEKARELAKKLLTLQSRQPLAYRILAPLDVWNRDVKGLKELEARLGEVGLDESDAVSSLLDRLSGRYDDRRKAERRRGIERWEKLAGEMRKNKKERSLAVALTSLVRTELRGEQLGEKIDADRVVKLAEEAQAAHLCRATTEKLIDALLYRAHRQLLERDPEYRKMAERMRRSLDASYLVALALTREGPAKALAAANPDVIRACKLVKERTEAFPDEPNPLMYALLKTTNPDAAAKVAEAFRTDEVYRVMRAIARKLNPLSLTDALGNYWVLKLEGKEKDADALLRTLGERGVPLPFDVAK